MKPYVSNAIIHKLQKKIVEGNTMKQINSFEPFYTPGRTVTKTGALWVNDIRYGDKFPNSYCDIWYPDEDTSAVRPTLFYFHGGGFFFGSKTMGDPLAVAGSEDANVITEYLKLGFNVVNADYALATEYLFPTPFIQMNDLFRFFLVHGKEYGITMEQVVLMGGSAGADMVEIYGTAINNAEYARELGFAPVIDEKTVKVIIVDEAALSVDSFGFNMKVLTRSFLGEHNLNGKKGKLLNAPMHLRRKYIPVFINTSNEEPWFLKSAEDLRDAVKKYGSEYEFCYFEPSVEKLPHGYINNFTNSKCAAEGMQRMKDFTLRFIEI